VSETSEPDPRYYAHAASVTARRYEIPAVPGDWDTGMLRVIADPELLAEVMPLRRGPVQGSGVLHPELEDLWWPAAEAETAWEPETAPEPETPRESETPGRAERLEGARIPRARRAKQPAGGARSSTSMAAATVVSRVGGMLAQLLQAAALGSSVLATTFTVGNTLPNMIYFLIIGGALNAVFMPQLVAAMRRGPDGGAAYVNRLLTLVFCALLVVTAAATLAAPWIVETSAGRLDSVHRALAVSFARYCMPQIFFYDVFAVVGQVLGARKRFGPTA